MELSSSHVAAIVFATLVIIPLRLLQSGIRPFGGRELSDFLGGSKGPQLIVALLMYCTLVGLVAFLLIYLSA